MTLFIKSVSRKVILLHWFRRKKFKTIHMQFSTQSNDTFKARSIFLNRIIPVIYLFLVNGLLVLNINHYTLLKFYVFKISASFNQSTSRKKTGDSDCRMSQVLQLLSRLTQFEVPHENLSSLKTIKALVKYLCYTENPSTRAERIILRLSK